MQDDKGGEIAEDQVTEMPVLDSDEDGAEQTELVATEPIQWTASDFVDHDRGVMWYIGAILIALAAIGLSIWLEQWSLGALALIILIAVFVIARKPAREVQYELSRSGLSIDGNLHAMNEFRAFGVRNDGALWQLVMLPVKRFGLSVTIFINEDQGEAIVDLLGAILPMEEARHDIVDKFSKHFKL